MYKRQIYGSEHLRELADRGALIGDPLLSTLLVFALFGFCLLYTSRCV